MQNLVDAADITQANICPKSLSMAKFNPLLLKLGKETFKEGETINITLTNTGNETLAFPDTNYGLVIKNSTGKEVGPYGVVIPTITPLAPGESVIIPFSPKEPGLYTVESSPLTPYEAPSSASATFRVLP